MRYSSSLCVLLWSPLVMASAPESPVSQDQLLEALNEELQRNFSELHLPDAPPLYHLRYTLALGRNESATASYGALLSQFEGQDNTVWVEVRVGSPDFDNTNFGGRESGLRSTDLPDLLTPESLRLNLWRLTDRAYKDAVDQLARKSSNVPREEGAPGDFQMTGPAVWRGDVPSLDPEFDAAALTRSLSAAFPPGLDQAQVHTNAWCGGIWIVDTEGTQVQKPGCSYVIRALAHTYADDGMRLTDSRLWMATSPAGLPPLDRLREEVARMGQDLLELREAPALDEEYVGPVLFEDAAAADLFYHLLTYQLEGTPPVTPFDTAIRSLRGGNETDAASGVRLNRRVLPSGWTVRDEPQADPNFPGTYPVDDEGVPAQALLLVEDGIVRTVAMSRVPREGLTGTNGHAQTSQDGRRMGRVTQVEVQARRTVSERRMRRDALRLASAYGRDWVIVVRRLQVEAVVDDWGSGFYFFLGLGGPEVPQLPAPVEIVRLYADGHEERLRGAEFAGAERWILRDIVDAGPSVSIDNLAHSSFGPNGGLVSGLPVRVTAPEVLLSEVELLPVTADPQDKPLLPLPSGP